LEFSNSNFVGGSCKIPKGIGIISSCQEHDVPHLDKFFIT
jgi:hypothetical protein